MYSSADGGKKERKRQKSPYLPALITIPKTYPSEFELYRDEDILTTFFR